MMRPKLLLNIETARGIAAFGILVCHVIIFGVNKFGLGSIDLFRFSAPLLSGVDLFFLISGFVMIYATHDRSALTFLKKRVLRIYPLYWLVCLPLIPVLLYWPHLINASSPYPTSIMHSLLLIPHQGMPLLMVAWTLELEMYFYLVVAATLFLTKGRQYIVIAVFLISSMVLGLYFQPENAILQVTTSPFLLEFVIGMTLGLFAQQLTVRPAFSLSAILLGLLYIAAIPIETLPRVLHYGAGMTLILISIIGLEKNRITLPEPISKWLGKMSYPLFLFQIPMIVAIGRGFQWIGYPLPPLLYAVLTITLPLMFTAAFIRFIDCPLQRLCGIRRPD